MRVHIEELQQIRQRLNEELMHEDDLLVRNGLQAKIRAAEIALDHYQAALRLEQTLAPKSDST